MHLAFLFSLSFFLTLWISQGLSVCWQRPSEYRDLNYSCHISPSLLHDSEGERDCGRAGVSFTPDWQLRDVRLKVWHHKRLSSPGYATPVVVVVQPRTRWALMFWAERFGGTDLRNRWAQMLQALCWTCTNPSRHGPLWVTNNAGQQQFKGRKELGLLVLPSDLSQKSPPPNLLKHSHPSYLSIHLQLYNRAFLVISSTLTWAAWLRLLWELQWNVTEMINSPI